MTWLTPAALYAQGWPIPTAVGSTAAPASCSGCPQVRTNAPDGSPPVVAPTAQFSAPIAVFTGRFLDSAFTNDYQQTFRTARAWGGFAVPAKNRIYFMVGSSVAAYDAPTFFSRLEANQSLTPSSMAPVFPTNYRPSDYSNERFLSWDKFFYVENTHSGWSYPIIDRQQTMWGFDVDDRGFVYIAAADEGWGLVKDDGTNFGGLMDSTLSPQNLTTIDTKRIISIKGSGGKYYALTGNGIDATTTVWDVTSPTAMYSTTSIPIVTLIGAKTSDHTARACDAGLCVYTNDALVTGGLPQVIPPTSGSRYTGVASDGTNFFGLYTGTGYWGISVLTPNGSSYSETDYTYPDTFQPSSITYGAGHLALTGYVPLVGSDLYLVRLTDLRPTVITFNRFFTYYYSNPPMGFVNAHASAIYNAFPYSAGGKLYLVVSAFSLGDVYQVKMPDCSTTNPPNQVTATITTSSAVTLTWPPVAGASYYQVERNSGSGYSIIARPVNPVYIDTTVAPGASYVYKVATVNTPAGCVSSFGLPELATTVFFTDDPIYPGQTTVRATHFYELRAAANLVRSLAGLPPATWTDANLSGLMVNSQCLTELRAAIVQARGALSLPSMTFTDDPLSPGASLIRAAHITELRNAVK